MLTLCSIYLKNHCTLISGIRIILCFMDLLKYLWGRYFDKEDPLLRNNYRFLLLTAISAENEESCSWFYQIKALNRKCKKSTIHRLMINSRNLLDNLDLSIPRRRVHSGSLIYPNKVNWNHQLELILRRKLDQISPSYWMNLLLHPLLRWIRGD